MLVALLVLFLFLLVGRTADAQERRPVGKAALPKEPGTLLQRDAAGKAWKALGLGDPVHSGDLLLTLPGGPGALVSNDGAVGLTFGDGSPESTEANPVHVYQKAGRYQADLEVRDSSGDEDADYLEIEVEGQ